MKTAVLTLLGLTGVAGYVLSLVVGLPGLGLATKPLPVFCLAAAVFSAPSLFTPPSFYRRTIGAGLVLSLAGDVLLEFRHLFLAGLAAFLGAHLAYTAAFVSDERRLRPLRLLLFVAWMTAAGAFLWPGLGPMRLPVVLYMAAITAMMWRAAARVHGSPGAWAALSGAVLFGVSDTLIAFDRFQAPLPGVRYPIILLYWAGQAGIAWSARNDE